MTITYALIQMLEKCAEKSDRAKIVCKARATRFLMNGDKCVIDCDSGRRLAEAPAEDDAHGPYAEPAGRELVKSLLKDHPELDALRGADGIVADDVLDKLSLLSEQLFGQPALA